MAKNIIRTEYDDHVAIVKLNRSVTNPINLEVVGELTKIIDEIKNEKSTHGVVLSSTSEKFFSIGFDIPELFELSRDDFKTFYCAFNKLSMDLYTLPKFTIAALTGHAVAGGCILALCCDYRFIAEGKKKMGLNEIKLGVPIPYPADCMLRNLVGFRIAREIVDTGEFYLPEDLLQMGMVDRVLALDQVMPESIEKAKLFDSIRQDAYVMIKQNRVEAIKEQIVKRLNEKENYFLECWYSDEARERLKEAIAKF